MKNINLIIDGRTTNVTIERYFKLADQSYVIFSIDEADTDGNVKIFVAKVKDDSQVLSIDTQEEWDAVKNAIVGIVNDNKECNKLQVEDLNYQLLQNLEITDTKALRLPLAVMPYLSANMAEFNNIDLNQQEKALEEKTESLKEMNADLTNLMNEVNQEFAKVEPEVEEQKEEEIEEPAKADNMEATMEIIMPSKSFGEELEEKEKHKKKKNKFSFKNLFGKKEHEETEEQEEEQKDEPITDAGIIHETDLPNPVALDPIVVDEIPVVENEQETIENDTLITFDEPSNDEDSAIELPNDMSTEFNFEEVNSEPIAPTFSQIPEVVLPDLPIEPTEEPMEILEVDDESSKYKNLYEQEKQNNQSLQEKNEKLEELIKSYHEKLTQIRDIVR